MEKAELLNRKEVAELLSVSLPTLNVWSKNGLLKPIKLNTRVRYLKSDIEALLIPKN